MDYFFIFANGLMLGWLACKITYSRKEMDKIKGILRPKNDKIKLQLSLLAAAFGILLLGLALGKILIYYSENESNEMVIENSVFLVDEFSDYIYSEDFTFDDGVIYRNELEFLLKNYFLEIKDSNIFTEENLYSFYETLFRDALFGGLEVKKGLKIKDSSFFFDETNSKGNMRLIDVDVFYQPEENEDILNYPIVRCEDSDLILNYETLEFECDFPKIFDLPLE